jgi:(p)ppGpp synthase/HD superfamily hydrolase
MIFTSKVRKAQKFAIKAHGDQKYGDEFPYAIHLMAVVSVLLRFGITGEDLLCVAWLHDTLEDTQATYEEIVTYFGQEIADAVSALSEPKGGNRKWRHEQTYPRIRLNAQATLVKLADRIANIESGGKKIGMYAKEHADFKAALINVQIGFTYSDAAQNMWHHLDDLVLSIPALWQIERHEHMRGV